MGRIGAWVLAALASGCLQSPPSSAPPLDPDGGALGEDGGGPGAGILFPPPGAEVRITAAQRADVDLDGGDELILLDDDVGDDFAGLYILWSGESGWRKVEALKLDFRPTALRYGRMVRPAGVGIVVGGANGELSVVDYRPGGSFEIFELLLDPPPTGGISIVHTGVVLAQDTTASMVFHDGTALWATDPIVYGSEIGASMLTSDAAVDAAFWPLTGTDPADFIAARSGGKVEWFGASPGQATLGDAVSAQFAHLVIGMCGTHLVIGADSSAAIGWITCDGMTAHLDPLVGHDIPEVKAMVAGDLAGTAKHDLALIGLDDGVLYGRVLVDLGYSQASSEFSAAEVTEPVSVDGMVPEVVHLLAADVEGDGSALIYAIEPTGGVYCGEVQNLSIAPCPPGWQITAP